ncbi:hypothetical protein LGH83_02840 [Lichenihabitans sp. PAMC28606]|uniref:hypothetical protein n=1 Tax=Lichenihabitans sp. PAMC28606 TaxID=2880932 RepID=UPI001D0A69D7|nr:hypothetical protein [Lichenihabitans sp. PAMC28606]UDL95190.1 hypothetical protein LGH83_02840 [Lichenihabitans sp. PAMC28606]
MVLKATLLSCFALIGLLAGPADAQETKPQDPKAAEAPQAGTVMLTIFFKHDQSRPLDQLNAQLTQQKFYETFPPKDVEIVSWYVMMGIGQVVTLRFPAERLREINRAVERTAWGPYRTEFYPTYDYKPTAVAERSKLK